MHNYSDLELQALLDLLVIHTTEYTKKLSSHTSSVEEIAQCTQILKDIHSAIETKHKDTLQIKILFPEKKEKPDMQY